MFENIVYQKYGWYLQTNSVMYEGSFYYRAEPVYVLVSIHAFIKFRAVSRCKHLTCYDEYPYTEFQHDEMRLPSRKEVTLYKLKHSPKYCNSAYGFKYVYELVEELFNYEYDVLDTLAFGEIDV